MQIVTANPTIASPGLKGLQSAQQGIQQASRRIVSSTASTSRPLDNTDLARDFVDLKRQTILFDASAKVVKATEGNVGRLIYILA